jgi:hypothetical protein
LITFSLACRFAGSVIAGKKLFKQKQCCHPLTTLAHCNNLPHFFSNNCLKNKLLARAAKKQRVYQLLLAVKQNRLYRQEIDNNSLSVYKMVIPISCTV